MRKTDDQNSNHETMGLNTLILVKEKRVLTWGDGKDIQGKYGRITL